MLTKDDLHIIENLVDIQRGRINHVLTEMCEVSIHMEAFKQESPLKPQIKSYQEAWERYTAISKKLEEMRLKDDKSQTRLVK